MRVDQVMAALKLAMQCVDKINTLVPRLTEEGRHRDCQKIIDDLNAELRELGMVKVADRLPRLMLGSRVRQTYDALIEVLKDLLLAVSAPLEQGPATSKKRRRGPRPMHDAKADEQLLKDWEAAKRQGTTKKEFCNDRGIKLKDLTGAQTRRRERKSRDF